MSRVNLPVFIAALAVVLSIALFLWSILVYSWPLTVLPALFAVGSLATYGLVTWEAKTK
ncbi:hypothetical protein [Schaalia radingae]|nr:hypothetical protein [Schaalia radingae]